MALTRVEKERISDSRLKIQSAVEILSEVPSEKIPSFDEIQSCLESAERNLNKALRRD
jgi:hypothetical protein